MAFRSLCAYSKLTEACSSRVVAAIGGCRKSSDVSTFHANEVEVLKNTLTSSMPRGRGGRSSFSGHVVTIFGASGYMGSVLANRFCKIGSQVIMAYHGDPYYVRHLKLCGDLGQVLFCPIELKDQESLDRAVQHSNVVINLVGRDWETSRFKFQDVHVDGARAIARAARKAGVRRLIHMSALNAAERPAPAIMGRPSQLLRYKWLGEQAVREEYPDAVIFRPAGVWGGVRCSQAKFLPCMASFNRTLLHNFLPIHRRGEHTIKQPVYVGDIAKAVIASINSREAVGKTFDAVGPHRYLLSDLMEWIYRVLEREILRVPMWVDPFYMWFRYERLQMEALTDELRGDAQISELIDEELTNLESRMYWELHPWDGESTVMHKLQQFPRTHSAPIQPPPSRASSRAPRLPLAV